MLTYKRITLLKKNDLFYKYNLINSFLLPTFKKLVILLSIKDFLAAYNYGNIKESSMIHVTTFSFLYLLFGQLPFISLQMLKNLKYKDFTSSEFLYTLKIEKVSVYSIFNFLNFLTIENYSSLNKITSSILCSKLVNFSNVVISTHLRSEKFNNLNLLTQKFFDLIDLKALSINLKFFIKKPKSIENNGFLFKNLYRL
jgi:hypothetical protein